MRGGYANSSVRTCLMLTGKVYGELMEFYYQNEMNARKPCVFTAEIISKHELHVFRKVYGIQKRNSKIWTALGINRGPECQLIFKTLLPKCITYWLQDTCKPQEAQLPSWIYRKKKYHPKATLFDIPRISMPVSANPHFGHARTNIYVSTLQKNFMCYIVLKHT